MGPGSLSLGADSNVITDKWVLTQKFHADESFDCYKARWVLRGFSQFPRVNYNETFSPVVNPTTVHTVLTIAVSRDWPVQQLNVKNAFSTSPSAILFSVVSPKGLLIHLTPIWSAACTSPCMD
jgi:hypothetical protein